jgi:hypothetical protein
MTHAISPMLALVGARYDSIAFSGISVEKATRWGGLLTAS